MNKKILIIALLILLATSMITPKVHAADKPENKEANSVTDCTGTIVKGKNKPAYQPVPVNCIFLEEPIGGKPGYDLYYIECIEATATEAALCDYNLWGGQSLRDTQHGPIQAILSYEPGGKGGSSFGLLYNYVALIYKYLSGVIIGFVVLMTIIGGLQITTAQGDSGGVDAGKSRITNALLGMALWFLASLILYTINPTFFRF